MWMQLHEQAGVRFPAAKSVFDGDNEPMAMSEAEWNTSTDPTPMLELLQGKASDRKLRLLLVACCYLEYRKSKTGIPAFDIVERFADGQATLNDVRTHWLTPGSVNQFAWPERPLEWAASFVTQCPRSEEDVEEDQEGYPPAIELPPIFRDIFGNPFRPVTINPAWRTSNVTALAQSIYADRAFNRMPILADALEDAGCDNADILNHCRQPGEHVRGCWVVDLLLGKE
jgi:hypothetical protein